MSHRVAGLPRFRSAPAFEEALCTSCLRAGDPDPYWPIDQAFWPMTGRRFNLRICLACRIERRHHREQHHGPRHEQPRVTAPAAGQ